MKLIVKPININNLNKIEADAFIFGMENFSVNATSVIDIEMLKSIKKDLNKEIFVSIDKNLFDEDISSLKELLLEIDKLNIKGILFYDITLLALKEELNITTPLIWNQNFFVTNYRTINYYENLGIRGAVIANEITIDEVKEITSKTNVDLFVNTFGYQMMAFSKRKLISNYYKYIKGNDKENEHYLEDKDGSYRIIEEKEGTAILSKYVLNTLNEYNNYKDMGIDYLILDAKCLEEDIFVKVLDVYKRAENEPFEKLIKEINNLLETSTGFSYIKTIYKVK